MTEKHNWITDDLCLIEETTGVKLYGTVCTDMAFIAKQLNDANKTIKKFEKENKELKEKNEQLRFGLKKIKGVLHSLEDENKNLKVTIEAREVLIDVCEKKFRELGYIITVDDDGYVIE